MTLIDCQNLCKQFGEKVVLNEANFSVQDGEKIAVIGKNGAGKSTLLGLLLGTVAPDSGRVICAKSASIRLLAQGMDADGSASLREHIRSKLHRHFSALEEYSRANEALALSPHDGALMAASARLANEIDSLDAWDIERKIERAFAELDLLRLAERPMSTLSGGEQRRANLCALLLENPDVMILDEPTNHLDLAMCDYLINMLRASRKCVIVVSHDRFLIDAVAERCIELEAGQLRSYEGAYAEYLRRKAEELASAQKSHETLLKQLKSEEEWLRRGVKARLKRNEGRKERIMAMREQAKKNPAVLNNLRTALERALPKSQTAAQGTNRRKMLFELEQLGICLGGRELISGFSARILQGEKIAIVGKNGSGKSTLLRLLLGEIEPSAGKIRRAQISIGYFAQSRPLPEEATLVEYFCPNGGDIISVRGQNMHVFGYLKKFGFPKEQLGFKIGALSGGERARVALAKLFTHDYDLLILDEPTNDLDIATINILESYLESYRGALIFVSHDRYFTDRLAGKLFAIEGGRVSVEHMSFSELAALQSEMKELRELVAADSAAAAAQQGAAGGGAGGEGGGERKKPAKLSYREQQILANHPALIEQKSREAAAICARLDAAGREGRNSELAELCALLDEANAAREALENELLEAMLREEEIAAAKAE